MGLRSLMSNKKKKENQSNKVKRHRQKVKTKIANHGGVRVGHIDDSEITTEHHLRKRRTSPRANITLSGKKKRKLMKQLKHMQAEKNQMEIVSEVESVKSKKKSDKSAANEEDVDTEMTAEGGDSADLEGMEDQ